MQAGTGLSPLARGTLSILLALLDRCRFIPAGAGNSVKTSPFDTNVPVYPRWRGELRFGFSSGSENSGLSPLARGTPDDIYCIPNSLRFIPAGAGNSSPTICELGSVSVYPRWRGELSKCN